jgi:hypothetical protein
MKPCLACKHTFGLPQMIAAYALNYDGTHALNCDGTHSKLEGYICPACFESLLSVPVSEPGALHISS